LFTCTECKVDKKKQQFSIEGLIDNICQVCEKKRQTEVSVSIRDKHEGIKHSSVSLSPKDSASKNSHPNQELRDDKQPKEDVFEQPVIRKRD
jgi:hypothetical protein